MLLAGNDRCVRRDDVISIKDAVHANPDRSRAIYDWVRKLCTQLGASDADMVPFEKYAQAAESLDHPSTVARTLFSGADRIERVDCLVQRIAHQFGMHSDALDEIVEHVNDRLARNRAARTG
jgi:hypothetical protein